MSSFSKIEWTHSSWNPVTGCSRVSEGCRHCYAERMAKRLQGMGVAKYANGFEVTPHPDVLEDPLKWKKPRLIFVNSMSDLFHEKIPVAYLRQIFDVMRRADWHVFQILTKRTERLAKMSPRIDWPPNVWMGVTVESARFTHRIDLLRSTGAAIKWLSMEPLLSAVPDINLTGIDWIVVGGESGPGARLMKKEWVVDIQRQCREQKVHFFFKQWGGMNKKEAGRKLNGRIYDAMPELPDPVGQISFGL
jgi:protein gp37